MAGLCDTTVCSSRLVPTAGQFLASDRLGKHRGVPKLQIHRPDFTQPSGQLPCRAVCGVTALVDSRAVRSAPCLASQPSKGLVQLQKDFEPRLLEDLAWPTRGSQSCRCSATTGENSYGRRFSTVGQGNERKVCALVQRRSDGQLHQATVGDGFTRGLTRPRNTASLPYRV